MNHVAVTFTVLAAVVVLFVSGRVPVGAVAVLVAVLTALISVNGAVAALLPVVVVMAVRLEHAPSQLLMPLVFAAHAGSLLALTGTPVNVLVSDDYARLGLPLLVLYGVVAVLLVPVFWRFSSRPIRRATTAGAASVRPAPRRTWPRPSRSPAPATRARPGSRA